METNFIMQLIQLQLCLCFQNGSRKHVSGLGFTHSSFFGMTLPSSSRNFLLILTISSGVLASSLLAPHLPLASPPPQPESYLHLLAYSVFVYSSDCQINSGKAEAKIQFNWLLIQVFFHFITRSVLKVTAFGYSQKLTVGRSIRNLEMHAGKMRPLSG